MIMPEKLLFAVLVCFFISSRALFTITGRHLSCCAAPGKRIDYSTKFFSYNRFEEEGKGISPKVLLTAAVLSFGVFGTGFIGTIQQAAIQITAPAKSSSTEEKLKNDSGEKNRGALTRMTRKEINYKLEKVPVFFASLDNGKSIYTADSIGFLFTEKEDADAFVANQSNRISLKVSAATLDEVYFPLIEKKAKLGTFIEGVAGKSDPSATYRLTASKLQVDQTTDDWKRTHEFDVPLFRVPKLAFSKENGLEVPLFLKREDALDAFNKLKESRNVDTAAKTALNEDEEIQVTSLVDLVQLFSGGGFQLRAVEFYPSIPAIEQARALILGPSSS